MIGRPRKYPTEELRQAAYNQQKCGFALKNNWHCDDCDRMYIMGSKWRHLKTKKHISEDSDKQYLQPWICNVCNLTMTNGSGQRHRKSKKHQLECANSGIVESAELRRGRPKKYFTEEERRRANTRQNNESKLRTGWYHKPWYCAVCDRRMNRGAKDRHEKSKKHRASNYVLVANPV